MHKKATTVVCGLAVIFLLYLTSRFNYLLFHSLVEITSVVISGGIFMVAWHSRRFFENDYLIFIGLSFLFIGGIDLLHTITYKNMGVFPGSGANLPTQLWIASRYLQSFSFLVAPLFLYRKLSLSKVFAGFAAVALLLLISIFLWKVFPDCFVEGSGLTAFKKASEYIIALLLLTALALMFRKRQSFHPDVVRLLSASIVLLMLAGMAFTLYTDVFGVSNMAGHILKTIAFYLSYRAIVETGLSRPYDLLFRELQQANELLEQRVEERTSELSVANAQLQTEITERTRAEEESGLNTKRLQILNAISQHSAYTLQELLVFALEKILIFSDSRYGYIYDFHEESGFFTLHAWSKDVMNECSITSPQKTYHLQETGIWGEAVRQRKAIIVNDYAAPNPLKKGYPEGHTPLTRFMTVPIFKEGRIVAVAGLANRPGEYTENDARQLTLLMESVWRIGEHKHAEHEIWKLSHAVTQSSIAIVITDLTGKIEYINPKFTEYSGYTLEEAMGENPRILKSGMTPDKVYKELWETLVSGDVWEGELSNRKKDGGIYWEWAKISPIKSKDGVITHYMAFKEDITKQKHLQEKLLQSQRLKALGQIAGGVAHEVRNPLNAILSITEALFREKEIEENPEYEPYIGHIRSQVGRLANLMNDLLDLGKAIPAANLNPLPLHDLCRETIKMVSSFGATRQHQFSFDASGAPQEVKVRADAVKFQQILFNLLENAAQNSPDGSEVALHVLASAPGSSMAVIRIIDSGNGVPLDKIKRIFEPFYTTRKSGTGLGLALVKHNIENMGGNIAIWNNTPLSGCTAELSIPLAKEEL